MLFGLFGKKEKNDFVKKFTNSIYMSENAKQKAIVALAQDDGTTVFIAWFTYTVTQYRKIFATNNLDDTRVVEAKTFSNAKYGNNTIVFLEHYPLRTKEEALVKNCLQENFIFFNSLTEPIFQYFGGDRIIDLMQRMGGQADEKIEHTMIDKSLLKAQEKIAEKVPFETNTSSSQQEWMLVNVGNSNH
jgi:hypothetical protein